MEYINWTLANWESVATIALSVVGVFSMIATLTPTPKDDAIVSKLQAVVHFLGMNFGQAKNDGKSK